MGQSESAGLRGPEYAKAVEFLGEAGAAEARAIVQALAQASTPHGRVSREVLAQRLRLPAESIAGLIAHVRDLVDAAPGGEASLGEGEVLVLLAQLRRSRHDRASCFVALLRRTHTTADGGGGARAGAISRLVQRAVEPGAEEGGLGPAERLGAAVSQAAREQSDTGPQGLLTWMAEDPLAQFCFGAALEPVFPHLDTRARDRLLGLWARGDELEGALLDQPTRFLLDACLPLDLRGQWERVFSSTTYGHSFSGMRRALEQGGATVIVVRDKDGHVFGGFGGTPWRLAPDFGGTENSFLFASRPQLAVYRPSGKNRHFQYYNHGMETLPNGIGFGGQLSYFGLWIDASFETGHSRAEPRSTTFNSPRLSKAETFAVDTVEVWRVGPLPKAPQDEAEGAASSILDGRQAEKAFLTMAGKKVHSEGLRGDKPP